MRTLIGLGFGVALVAFMPTPAAAADVIVCGRIMGYAGPTAAAAGSLVIPQPGDIAPAGTYIVIPRGTQFDARGTGWSCVRATTSGPTTVFGGFVSTLTFAGFVQPGSPGYRAEPAASPAPGGSRAVGGLPGTSTRTNDAPIAQLALGAAALMALLRLAFAAWPAGSGALRGTSRRSAGRG